MRRLLSPLEFSVPNIPNIENDNDARLRFDSFKGTRCSKLVGQSLKACNYARSIMINEKKALAF